MSHVITLQEHCLSVLAIEASETTLDAFPTGVKRRLIDVGQERLAEMEKSGITFQILSHLPTNHSQQTCFKINSDIQAVVRAHFRKFAALALLPMEKPALAAIELRRYIQEFDFVGAMVPSHIDGRFLDQESFQPVFEEAQNLDVPLYIYPAHPSQAMVDVMFKGSWPESVTSSLSAWAWGWHSLAGTLVLRLYASGLFDRCPRIKIIIGHMGETLPFMIDRIMALNDSGAALGKKDRDFREVWDTNIWVTTAGMFSLAPFACLLDVTMKDRILFSVGYPFHRNEEGKKFLDEVEQTGLLDTEELQMLTYKNAAALFGWRLERLM